MARAYGGWMLGVPGLVAALGGLGCADHEEQATVSVDEPDSPPAPLGPLKRSGAVLDPFEGRGVSAPCTAGTYAAEADASVCLPWSVCPPGQYVESDASRTVDRACADCAAGTHTTADNSPRCVPNGECAPGTQAVDASSSEGVVCEACPEGTWNDGTERGTCRTATTCEAGFAVLDDLESTHDRRCEQCPAGTYSDAQNAAACSACEPGSFCRKGSAAPESCADETWDDDGDPGTHCVTWSDCPDGFREVGPGTSMTDRECWPGEWYRELGTTGGESAAQVALDEAGDVYVAGVTRGDFDGHGKRGGDDVFIRKLSGGAGTEIWRVQLGTTEPDSLSSISIDASGSVVLVGSCFESSATSQADNSECVHRLSPNDGTLLGTLEIQVGNELHALAVSPGGEIAAFGSLGSADFVKKLDASGNTLWQTNLEEPISRSGRVAFDPSGNVAVSYSRSAPDDDYDAPGSHGYVTLFASDDGNPLWTTGLYGDFHVRPSEIVSDGGDRLLVNVHTADYDGNQWESVALLDRETGEKLWTTSPEDASFTSAAFAPGGDVFLQDGHEVQRLAGQDGSELWARTLAFEPRAVVAAPSGDAVVAGNGWSNHDVLTERLDGADGSTEWRDSVTTSSTDRLNSVVFDAAGDVIAGGGTEANFERAAPNGAMDALIVKLSGATGESLWTRQFGSDGSDEIDAVSVDALGDVVVGGSVQVGFPTASWDWFVSKLSGSDGSTLWSTQYGSEDATEGDYVEALAVDALGDVVVTGSMGERPPAAEHVWPSAHARKLSGTDGTLIWETTLGAETSVGWSAPNVGVMPNGDAIVTWIMGENEEARSWIARLSGMGGSTAWAARLDSRQLYVVGLAVDANGDIAVSLDGIYGSQDSVIKLAGEDGSRLWARDRQAGAVAFHEAGGVIVGSVGAEGFQITLLASTNGSLLNAVPMHFGDLANVTLAMSAAGDIALAGSTWANPPATVHYPDTQAFVSKLPK